MYSKAKILKHPVHPVMVVFPVAFYTATFAAYVAHAVTLDRFWFQMGVVSNALGVLAALSAAVPGFIDWAFGIPRHHPAKTVGLEHMVLNVSALVCFGVAAGLQYAQWNSPAPTYAAAVALSGIGFGLTVAAVFLGWKLVHQHHVGTDLTDDQQERLDVARARSAPPSRSAIRRA